MFGGVTRNWIPMDDLWIYDSSTADSAPVHLELILIVHFSKRRVATPTKQRLPSFPTLLDNMRHHLRQVLCARWNVE